MRHLTFILAASIGLALVSTAEKARAQADLLVPAQAADVLADLITVTSARADARVDAMHRYLREIGKDEAFYQAKAPPPEKPIPFNEVFKGAILFVKTGGGAQYADPALAGMNNEQLTNELTELQVYNIQTFQHVVQQRQSVDAMKAYLKSSGNLEGYEKWAKEHAPAEATAQPTAKSSEQVAARMGEMIDSARSTAWKKAEARGMSEAEFEQAWKQRVEQHRDEVAKNVEGCKKLAQSLTSSPPPAPAARPLPPASPIITGPGPAPVAPAAPPPTVQSQYSQQHTAEMYQQRNDELWNRWDD